MAACEESPPVGGALGNRLSAPCQHDSSKRVQRRLIRKALEELKRRVCLDTSHHDQPVRELDKLGVTGSSPVPPTSRKPRPRGVFPLVRPGSVPVARLPCQQDVSRAARTRLNPAFRSWPSG